MHAETMYAVYVAASHQKCFSFDRMQRFAVHANQMQPKANDKPQSICIKAFALAFTVGIRHKTQRTTRPLNKL